MHTFLILLFHVIPSAKSASECRISESSLSTYWTLNNKLKPDGCIDRSNVSLVQIDHGGLSDNFWKLPRAGATRACLNYGGMNCDVTTTQDFDLNSMAELIEAVIFRDNVYGLAASLPGDEIQEELLAVARQNIEISTLNSGIDSYIDYGSSLHVGQDEFIAGFKGCVHLKEVYNVTKILLPDHESGENVGITLRADGCIAAVGNESAVVIFITKNSVDPSARIIAEALISDPQIDGMLALAPAGAQAFTKLVTHSDPASVYNITTQRIANLKAAGTFDFNPDILASIMDETNPTKFAIDQQPFLQGFLPLYFMGIKATTSNYLMEPTAIYSGPAFIETEEHIQLLECNTNTVHYCHDDEEHLETLSPGCTCIESSNHTIYLFHHGGDISSFYNILVSGAQQAADDINFGLSVHTFSHSGNQALDLDAYSTFVSDIITNNIEDIDGIITTTPNRDIGEIFLMDMLSGIQIIGIADSYDIYSNLGFNHLIEAMFVGMNDELAAYNMSQLIHLESSLHNGSTFGILCLDEAFGVLSSINERCNGVSRYCIENGFEYMLVSVDASNVDGSMTSISQAYSATSSSVVGIVGTAESSCLSATYFIEDIGADIVLGCFDTSQNVLDGLLDGSIDFVYEQQPFLIGYTAMLMMTNKVALDSIPSQLLVETGPRLITHDDKHIIYSKECENYYVGYEFCPSDVYIVHTLIINFPHHNNFGGVVIITLFILSVIVSVGVGYVMYLWKNEAMFGGLNYELMTLTMTGGVIMMMSGLFVFNDDVITRFMCNGPWAIWSIGFTAFFGSYCLRIWQFVVLIESGLMFRKNSVTQKGLLIRLCILVLIDLLLVVLASTLTPFEATSKTEVEQDISSSIFTETTTSFCAISSSNKASLWILSFVYKFIILIWVITVALRQQSSADKIQKLRYIKFQEGSNVAVGVYMVIVSFLIFGLIAVAMGNNEGFTLNVQWSICSFLSFLSYLTIICCVIFHRIMHVYKKRRGTITIKTEDEEIALDPYLMRAEFHINAAIDVVDDDRFTKDAASSLATLIKELSSIITKKEYFGANVYGSKQNVPSKTDTSLAASTQNTNNDSVEME